MKNIIGIYHGKCIDGTAAAAVLLKKFPEAKVFPLPHGYTTEDIAEILELVTAETEVYTVDCSLGVKEFLQKGVSVTTIDHHIGGKEELETLAHEEDNFNFIFDNEKSGASLTWSYFFPEEELPELIKYVEDADIWTWKYGDDTKHVNNYLSMYRNDPEKMLGYIEHEDIESIKEKGSIISKYTDLAIEKHLEILPNTLRIGEWEVPAYNITSYHSMCGNKLSKALGKTVAMYTINGDEVSLGFRSCNEESPTSLELATVLGGGGHTKASGARMSLKEFLEGLGK